MIPHMRVPHGGAPAPSPAASGGNRAGESSVNSTIRHSHQLIISRLLPLGFSSQQITAAFDLLGASATEPQVIGFLLNEDTGSPTHVPEFTRGLSRLECSGGGGVSGGVVSSASHERVNAEVQLRAMGFTTVHIAAARDAVGSYSLPAMTDFLLKSACSTAVTPPLLPPAAAVGRARDRAELVREMKRCLKDFSEVQIDNALDAVESVAGGGSAPADEIRHWIQKNMISSMRPSVKMIRTKLLELSLAPDEATRKAEAAHRSTSTLQGVKI